MESIFVAPMVREFHDSYVVDAKDPFQTQRELLVTGRRRENSMTPSESSWYREYPSEELPDFSKPLEKL
jgi:hypothetical protein